MVGPPGESVDGHEWPDAEPSLEALEQKLAERLVDFEELYDIDPAIIQAYGPGTTQLYTYPGMDTGFERGVTLGKLETLQTFKAMYKLIYVDKLGSQSESAGSAFTAMPRVSRAERRDIAYDKGSIGDVQAMARSTDPELIAEAKKIARTRDDGIIRSRVLSAVSLANDLHFTPLLAEDADVVMPEDANIESYIQFAFGDTRPTTVTWGMLHSKLREKDVISVSKEQLDARLEHFVLLSQVEASKLFLEDLCTMSVYGLSLRKLFSLANKYHDALLSDDHEAKIAMHQDVANTFYRDSLQHKDRTTRRLLTTLQTRSHLTSVDLADYVTGFTGAYEQFGYPLPDRLRPEPDHKADIPDIPRPVIEPVAIIGNVAVVEGDGTNIRLLDELATENEALHAKVSKFWREWRLSAKERRGRGLVPMQRDLTVGFKDEFGRRRNQPVTKEDAQLTVDILSSLNRLVLTHGADAHEVLTASVTEQQSLQEEVAFLALIAKEAGISLQLPFVVPVAEQVALLQEHWRAYRQLIIHSWPNFEGSQTVNRLETMLFEAIEFTPSITDDSSIHEQLTMQQNIARQLDRIILPPGAKKEDVERAIAEATGSGRIRPMQKVEWQRFADLIEVSNVFDGTIFLSKSKTLGGKAPAYYVAIFSIDGDMYAVAETPVIDNATAVVAEKHCAGTWLEVLELDKPDAWEAGAVKIVHPKNKAPGQVEKILQTIIYLHTNQA